MADRERARRDTHIGSVRKLEELKREQEFRLEAFFDEKVGRNSLLKMSNLYAVDNFFAFQFNQRYFLFFVNQEDCLAATKICSQIYEIRMVYQETFLDGLHASSSTTYSGMLNHLNWFLFYGNSSGASKHGETCDRKWWSRQQPILSQMAKIPNFQVLAKRSKKNNWRKGSRGRTDLAVHLKQFQPHCWPEW